MDTSIQIGSIVRANKKTGTYIGEVTAIKEGDLHHPKQADVPFFHERKALSYREQTPVPKNMVKLYDGEVPDYKESLKAAYDKLKSELEADDSLFAEKSLRCLEELAKEYF